MSLVKLNELQIKLQKFTRETVCMWDSLGLLSPGNAEMTPRYSDSNGKLSNQQHCIFVNFEVMISEVSLKEAYSYSHIAISCMPTYKAYVQCKIKVAISHLSHVCSLIAMYITFVYRNSLHDLLFGERRQCQLQH